MQYETTSLGNPRVNTTQHLRTFAMSPAILLVLTLFATQSMQAQTFSVIHYFTGGADGSDPYFGVVVDRNGNLYGTTSRGGDLSCSDQTGGCGVVYKITPEHTLSTLYTFTGGAPDGAAGDWLTIGPNGTLYGTTIGGGAACFGANYPNGCGTVFSLQPPAHICASTYCPWQETVLYRFKGPPDDAKYPSSIVFDSHGNMFGVAQHGGTSNDGAVFELTPSSSGWTEQVLYSFTGGQDGWFPNGPLAIDSLGNLYGIASNGGQNGYGTVFELSPSGSGWAETTLFAFSASTARFPEGGLIFDSSGNLFGSTGSSAVFELSPFGDVWIYQQIYALSGTGSGAGLWAPLAMNGAGNLYGTTYSDGEADGTVYELTFSGGSWVYTLLHQFSGSDGENPDAGVSFDSSGNLYGTTYSGGNPYCSGGYGCGVVWEIMP